MGLNILITGAAGYVGGSIVADFLESQNPLFKNSRISIVVRSDEQVKSVSGLGVNVLQFDLANEEVVVQNLLQHGINIVVHTASSLDPTSALNLITGLERQRKVSGKPAYLIHTSAGSAFSGATGWPDGSFKDSGPIFEIEESIADAFPIRKADVAITTHAEELGVTSFIVVPPLVYGRGRGQWNQLSVVFPLIVQASVRQKVVWKFPEDTKIGGVHISDLSSLYSLIVEKILLQVPIPSGRKGYYFATAHDLKWWELLDRLAIDLKSRDLVDSLTTATWPGDDVAAKAFSVPVFFVQAMKSRGAEITAENGPKIGWSPKWNEERFLENIDDDVKAVLDLGKAKSSLVEALLSSSG